MENDEVIVPEVSALVTEDNSSVSTSGDNQGDQAAETDTDLTNETLTEIKEILLESKETSSDDSVSVQEVPIITEEEFLKFNNNFCVGITCVVLVCGIICGSVIALLFKGLFREN